MILSERLACRKTYFADQSAQKSFGQAFSKACGVKGRSPCRTPQSAKSFILTEDQEGSQNNSVNCFGVGNPIKGFP